MRSDSVSGGRSGVTEEARWSVDRRDDWLILDDRRFRPATPAEIEMWNRLEAAGQVAGGELERDYDVAAVDRENEKMGEALTLARRENERLRGSLRWLEEFATKASREWGDRTAEDLLEIVAREARAALEGRDR